SPCTTSPPRSCVARPPMRRPSVSSPFDGWESGDRLESPSMDETEEQEIPNGLVAVGGTLDPETLLRAYRAGIFPCSSEPAVTWWCADPRAVCDLGDYRPSRSLKKQIRRAGWRFTLDRDFTAVMRACAEPTPERPSTWISEEFIESYAELHRRG